MLHSIEDLTEPQVSESNAPNSLMQTLADGQRRFGTQRFPSKILQMKAADFIRSCVMQKVNLNGPKPFGDNVDRRDRSKAKQFYKIWTDHCETEEEKQWTNFTNHPVAGTNLYATWERNLRNFANAMIRKMVSKYLPIFNAKPGVKKKQAAKIGRNVGAIFDLISRANKGT